MILTTTLILLFFGLYLSLELLKRHFHLNIILTRKIAHFVSAILAVILSIFLPQGIFLVITIILLLFFVFSYHYSWLTSIHISKPKTYGEILFPITVILLALFFYNNHFILWSALLTLGISDTLAGLYNFSKKQFISWQGSLVFFLSTFLILVFLILFLSPPQSINSILLIKIIFISTIVTLAEHHSSLGFDNLTVPIILAILLKLFL